MDTRRFDPVCQRPSGLVVPVRIDPQGVAGPTRGQAQGKSWRSVAHGWYVPADTDSDIVEQRILEQAVRLPRSGGITGWAALRWRGAAFFDGTDNGGRDVLPVPLNPGRVGNLRLDPRARITREGFAPQEREVVGGIGCATVTRAVFDELRRTGRLRPAVVTIGMAAAARLITVAEMAAYIAERTSWTGVPLAREAVLLASDHWSSPPEAKMGMMWELDAGFPRPLYNRAVFDRSGNLLGYPDLLDPVAGVVGEFAGAHHRDPEQHRADVGREDLFRDHSLEYFTVVGKDLHSPAVVVTRMERTRARAKFLPPESCSWTLEPPAWWTRPLHR